LQSYELIPMVRDVLHLGQENLFLPSLVKKGGFVSIGDY
jgi:hypothetical protein